MLLVTGKKPKQKVLYWKIKRCFDIVFSVLMLVLLSPLMLVITIIVSISSEGAPIYRHRRIGKNGKNIYVLKFRTMVKGADHMIDTFSAEMLEEWNDNYRLENDPRVTKIGKLLRATKLDELPQLVNVICNDLSIVGPRPITEEELERYGSDREKLLSITPGVTGYWQAFATNDCSYQERMKMELEYVKNANLLWDIQIMLATIPKMFRKHAAH